MLRKPLDDAEHLVEPLVTCIVVWFGMPGAQQLPPLVAVVDVLDEAVETGDI